MANAIASDSTASKIYCQRQCKESTQIYMLLKCLKVHVCCEADLIKRDTFAQQQLGCFFAGSHQRGRPFIFFLLQFNQA